MKKSTKTRFAAIMAILLVLAMILPMIISGFTASAATGIKSLQDELAQSAKEQSARKDALAKVTNDKKSALDEKNALDENIGIVQDELEIIQAVIDEKATLIQSKKVEILDLTGEIEVKDELFRTRINSMYKTGSVKYVEVLLSATSFSDMLMRMQAVKQLANYDSNIVKTLSSAKTKLVEAKALIETEKVEYDEAKGLAEVRESDLASKLDKQASYVKHLENKESDLRAAEEAADREMAAAQAELNQLLKAEEERQARAKAEAEKKRQEQENQGNNNSGGSSGEDTSTDDTPAYDGGELGWPSAASTRVTSEFGMRYHPTLHYTKLHTGMDIGASYGTNVLAAEDGTVIQAQFNSAYGNMVTISHGNGLVTRYAHNSRLVVSAGDRVSRGQVIAKVGSTGYSTGNHIHFEVIINGQFKNPRNYL